jgi:hypothetical protein
MLLMHTFLASISASNVTFPAYISCFISRPSQFLLHLQTSFKLFAFLLCWPLQCGRNSASWLAALTHPVTFLVGWLFRTWCTASCRQRINAMVSTSYDLFSWNKCNIILLLISCMITLISIFIQKMLTLLALVLHHARLLLPSSSFSMLPPSSLSVDCLSPLTPLPQADLISLRSQAMPCSHVGHIDSVP